MRLSDTHIKWIMLVSGALTCTMIYAFIAPQAALSVHLRSVAARARSPTWSSATGAR